MKYLNNSKFIYAINVLWNYMKLNQEVEKSDLIIGCGCQDLNIPIRCAELYREGYAKRILFAGGLGKGTDGKFKKSEAETFRDIAVNYGVDEGDILIENKSTNTGDNFRFALRVLKENNICCNKIIIVHKPINERRTLASAKTILLDKEISITSFNQSFTEFLDFLKTNEESGLELIHTLVGDIQRLVVYPQFGWQVKVELPDDVINCYNYLKELGFSKYLINKEQINDLIKKYGIIEGNNPNYFY